MVEDTNATSLDRYREIVAAFEDSVAHKRAEFDRSLEEIRGKVERAEKELKAPPEQQEAAPVPVQARRRTGKIKTVLSRQSR